MPLAEATKWYHSNQYTAESKCEYCAGVIRHEPWCATQNALVAYAYLTAAGAAPLSESDTLSCMHWASPGPVLTAVAVKWRLKWTLR